MIFAITHDGTGKIETVATCQMPSQLACYLDLPNVVFVEAEDMVNPDLWEVDLETHQLVEKAAAPASFDLAGLQAQLCASIDAAAEQQRLRYITPGAGQMLEYQETEAEARAFVAGAERLVWPFLDADLSARLSDGETGLTRSQVAADCIATADAWRGLAGEIKRLRRTAKLAVMAATTAESALLAAEVIWPV